MSAGAIVAIALGVLVVLAAVLVITSARRADTRSGHRLIRPVRNPSGAIAASSPVEETVPVTPTGAEVERLASEVARPGQSVEKACAGRGRSLRPDRSRPTRLYASPIHEPHHGFAHAGEPRRVRCFRRGVPVARSRGRVRLGDFARQARRHPDLDRSVPTASTTYPRGGPGSPPTRPKRCQRPRKCTTIVCFRDGSRDRGALPEVRPPGLPRAGVPHISVVRASLSRFAVQPGRREARRTGASWAWTGSP